MSDGGIGDGIKFFATIKIEGTLNKDELQTITKRIRAILNERGVNGRLLHSVRTTADDIPTISISMKERQDG